MTVSADRFAQGMTYEEFKAQMTRNQERITANEQTVAIEPEDLAVLQQLPRPVNVLVLAEDWCGDVIDNLPVLGKLAEASGKLNVRVFLRDQNLDVMDQYLNHGQFRSIPVFAFFDDQFNQLGVFIERPDSVTARRAQLRQDLYAEHPEFGSPDTPITQLPEEVRTKLSAAMLPLRDRTKTEDNRDVIHAIRDIVAKAR